MKQIIIPTNSIVEAPLWNEDKIIVKQVKKYGYIKNWFCVPMTIQQYEKLIVDIETKKSITLELKEGK